jgi:hypothetical protein
MMRLSVSALFGWFPLHLCSVIAFLTFEKDPEKMGGSIWSWQAIETGTVNKMGSDDTSNWILVKKR